MIILDKKERLLGKTSYIDNIVESNSITFYGETTSTSYVDCDAYPENGYVGTYAFTLSESITTLILVSSPISISLAEQTTSVAINVDDVIYEPVMSFYSDVDSGFTFLSNHLLLTLSPGDHIIKMQIKVTGGQGAALRGKMTTVFLNIK
jgi:hypothetical protein